MIFSILMASVKNNELILVDGGVCRWHYVKKKNQITIYEIISLKKGQGSKMLTLVKEKAKKLRCTSIFCKCEEGSEANKWWKKRGFEKLGVETLRSGTRMLLWKLSLRTKTVKNEEE